MRFGHGSIWHLFGSPKAKIANFVGTDYHKTTELK